MRSSNLLHHITFPSRATSTMFLLVVLALSVAGCSVYARNYSLANSKPKPVSLMVSRKIDRPLFIVLDDNSVKDTWKIETAGCATNSSNCAQFDLLSVQSFVRRDLKAAMESYFSRVEVVGSRDALPATPHVVADVRIDDIRLNDLVRGRFVHSIIEMTWGFALRPNELGDYTYSFAGTATSNDSYPSFEVGCATMIENAIPAMLKKWLEDGGMAALRELDS